MKRIIFAMMLVIVFSTSFFTTSFASVDPNSTVEVPTSREILLGDLSEIFGGNPRFIDFLDSEKILISITVDGFKFELITIDKDNVSISFVTGTKYGYCKITSDEKDITYILLFIPLKNK